MHPPTLGFGVASTSNNFQQKLVMETSAHFSPLQHCAEFLANADDGTFCEFIALQGRMILYEDSDPSLFIQKMHEWSHNATTLQLCSKIV